MTARRWILSTLAGAAVLAVLAHAARAQAPAAAARPVATVNGESISLADVEAILKHHPPGQTPPTETQRRQMQMEALALLMDDKVLQQFLRKCTPPVDPAEVNKKLGELETAQRSQGRTLQDFLRDNNQTEEQLRSTINTLLQWTTYLKKNLGEPDVRWYYDQNKDFFDQVTVRASHIWLRVSPEAPDAERQALRARLQALRQDIVSGKIEFAEAAKKFSQCESAPRGGDIGYFPRKWALEENFAKTAFAMKVGDLSDVVQTDFGFHLIKVTDRKPGTPSNYEKIKDEVREICAEDLRLSLIAQQRQLAKIEINLP